MRARLGELLGETAESPDPERLVPIPCRCHPPRNHGPHWVPVRRLAEGGDLRGKVEVPVDVQREIAMAA